MLAHLKRWTAVYINGIDGHSSIGTNYSHTVLAQSIGTQYWHTVFAHSIGTQILAPTAQYLDVLFIDTAPP